MQLTVTSTRSVASARAGEDRLLKPWLKPRDGSDEPQRASDTPIDEAEEAARPIDEDDEPWRDEWLCLNESSACLASCAASCARLVSAGRSRAGSSERRCERGGPRLG